MAAENSRPRRLVKRLRHFKTEHLTLCRVTPCTPSRCIRLAVLAATEASAQTSKVPSISSPRSLPQRKTKPNDSIRTTAHWSRRRHQWRVVVSVVVIITVREVQRGEEELSFHSIVANYEEQAGTLTSTATKISQVSVHQLPRPRTPTRCRITLRLGRAPRSSKACLPNWPLSCQLPLAFLTKTETSSTSSCRASTNIQSSKGRTRCTTTCLLVMLIQPTSSAPLKCPPSILRRSNRRTPYFPLPKASIESITCLAATQERNKLRIRRFTPPPNRTTSQLVPTLL